MRSEILRRTSSYLCTVKPLFIATVNCSLWRYGESSSISKVALYRSSTVLCVTNFVLLASVLHLKYGRVYWSTYPTLPNSSCVRVCVHTQSSPLLSTRFTTRFPVDRASLKIRYLRYFSFILKQCIPLLMPSCRRSNCHLVDWTAISWFIFALGLHFEKEL